MNGLEAGSPRLTRWVLNPLGSPGTQALLSCSTILNTSWSKVAAHSPAIMSTFQPEGRRKRQRISPLSSRISPRNCRWVVSLLLLAGLETHGYTTNYESQCGLDSGCPHAQLYLGVLILGGGKGGNEHGEPPALPGNLAARVSVLKIRPDHFTLLLKIVP